MYSYVKSSFLKIISTLGIGIASPFLFGMALNAIWERALHIKMYYIYIGIIILVKSSTTFNVSEVFIYVSYVCIDIAYV